MSTQSVADLIGEQLGPDGLGEDLVGDDLYAGYIPERTIIHIPPMQLGDGLAGPVNDQSLQVYRDTRPLAVDELGMGHLGKLARHRAGRQFPLNYEFGAGLSTDFPGRPAEQDVLHPSKLSPGESPSWHDGVPPVELVANPRTVFYTASPNVGWAGY